MEKNKNEIKIKKTHKEKMDILRYIYSAFVVISLVAIIILCGFGTVGLITFTILPAMFVMFEAIVFATIYWLFKYTITKE